MAALLAVAAPGSARGAIRNPEGGPAAGQNAGGRSILDAIARRATDAVRTYSGEGHHRTATAVDRTSADALLARARATGATASLEPFDLSRVDPVAAFAQIPSQRIEGLPMFDGAFTSADGVSGALGPIDSDRPIAWTRIAPNGEAALRRMRQGSRHAAIVAVTMGGKPGLCPVNAGWFSEPFGPPVLQVSSEHLAAFENASSSGVEARIVAHASRQRAQAFNVVTEILGADPTLPPVCVMTPRSGWHANASERGGGLVCWLETMRAIAARGPAEAGRHVRGEEAGRQVRRGGDRGLLRTVKFIASSGHELGHLGLHDYLVRNPKLAHDAYVWVHFGAIRQSQASQVGGEAATIKEKDGRFISFIGRNDWFHNPRDLFPAAVDIPAIARFARAVSDLTVQFANTTA